jgi:hypothetical protein
MRVALLLDRCRLCRTVAARRSSPSGAVTPATAKLVAPAKPQDGPLTASEGEGEGVGDVALEQQPDSAARGCTGSFRTMITAIGSLLSSIVGGGVMGVLVTHWLRAPDEHVR